MSDFSIYLKLETGQVVFASSCICTGPIFGLQTRKMIVFVFLLFAVKCIYQEQQSYHMV